MFIEMTHNNKQIDNKTAPFPPHRRRHERLPVNLELHYTDGVRVFTDSILDISLGGMRIESLRPIPPGTKLTASISSKPPLKICGEVRWTRKNGFKHLIGIHFVNVTLEQEFKLREIMQSLFWDVVQPYDR